MSRCPDCDVRIEGTWRRCPLCGAATAGDAEHGVLPGPVPGPLPAVPLVYSSRRLLQVLVLVSLGVILASFLSQLLLGHDLGRIGVVRSVWLGLAAMWLLVIAAVSKRRNLAKTTVYLVVLTGLICVYWDYLTGWHAWSLTFAIPAVCTASILALVILVRATGIETGDHVVYTGMTVLAGLTPLVFLVAGWVSTPWPSIVCGALAVVVMAWLQIARWRDLRHELAKRLHL